MAARCGDLVTADEPTAVSKSLLDAIVVEDGQSNRCLPDSSCADESDWSEGFCEANNLLDQLVAPETGPRWRRRGFTRYTGWENDAGSVGTRDRWPSLNLGNGECLFGEE